LLSNRFFSNLLVAIHETFLTHAQRGDHFSFRVVSRSKFFR